MANKESIIAWIFATIAGSLIVYSFMKAQPKNQHSPIISGLGRGKAYDHHPTEATMNPTTLRSLRMQALVGNPGAAGQLVEQFENCVMRHQAELSAGLPNADACERQMRFWIVIGSENGDLNMMGLRFNEYIANSSCDHTYRAKFWLERILRQERKEPWITMDRDVRERMTKCSTSMEANNN